jgi:hypothetical protein
MSAYKPLISATIAMPVWNQPNSEISGKVMLSNSYRSKWGRISLRTEWGTNRLSHLALTQRLVEQVCVRTDKQIRDNPVANDP